MSLFVLVQFYEWTIPILLTHLFLIFYFMQQSCVLVSHHYNNVIVVAIMILVFIGTVLIALCLNKVCRAKNSPYSLMHTIIYFTIESNKCITVMSHERHGVSKFLPKVPHHCPLVREATSGSTHKEPVMRKHFVLASSWHRHCIVMVSCAASRIFMACNELLFHSCTAIILILWAFYWQ